MFLFEESFALPISSSSAGSSSPFSSAPEFFQMHIQLKYFLEKIRRHDLLLQFAVARAFSVACLDCSSSSTLQVAAGIRSA